MGGEGGGNNRPNFGNQSGYSDLSSLFGGNRTFNLGAGSSSFDIKTNSVDLSSYLKDSSTNTAGAGGEGGGFDAAASVGVGVGGGSGSGGSVEKNDQSSRMSSLDISGQSGDKMPIYIALGVFSVGVLIILIKRKK